MSFTEVLAEVQNLSRQDKIKLIRFIAQDLERDEAQAIEPGHSYPMWSPTESFSAADTMLELLGVSEFYSGHNF